MQTVLLQKANAHCQYSTALCFPKHGGVDVNQEFHLAAMLLKIVWACMKGVIKTERGWEAEHHLQL